MVLVAKIAGRFWQAWAAVLAAGGNRAGLGWAWPGLGHNRIVIVIIVYEKSHSFLVLRWDAAMAGNPHWTNKLEFVKKLDIKNRKLPPGLTLLLSLVGL